MLFVPVFITIISAVATAAAAYLTVRTIRQQLKLYYSIQLVVLKTKRLQFLISAAVLGAASIICFVFLFGPENAVYEFCARAYSLNDGLVGLMLVSLVVMLLSLCALNCVLFFAKSAVVDRGIQTTGRFIGWHKLYYYLVDEDKDKVIFSLSDRGPYTLANAIGAFSFARSDAEKIKFILNKNKNKFVKHYEAR